MKDILFRHLRAGISVAIIGWFIIAVAIPLLRGPGPQAAHAQAVQGPATFLQNWQYVEKVDFFSYIPPLTPFTTPITLKYAPATDSTGALCFPVLVYLGNPITADGLAWPLSYTLAGNQITFSPTNIFNVNRPSVSNATEIQVIYVYSPIGAGSQ